MTGFDAVVDPHKTLRELFGSAENRVRFANDAVFQEYQKQIRRILAIADAYMLDRGEILIWINRTYALVWDTIPYFKFAEIEITLRRNWFRMHQFLNPEQHEQLMMSDNDYSTWFRYQERHTSPKEAPVGSND